MNIVKLARVTAALESSVGAIYSLLYPPVCLACGVDLSDRGSRICSSCFQSLKKMSPEDLLCKEMHSRLVSDGTLSGLVAAFHFEKDGTLQNLIHQLKYEEMTGIGVELGRHVGALLRSTTDDPTRTIIVPIPLHPVKKRARGYNQSEYVARGIAEVIGGTVKTSLLLRVKDTKTQAKLNRDDRAENMQNAFMIARRRHGSIENASIVLVDDVITTGATMRECTRVLRDHGASRVLAASIALADHALDVQV